MKNVKPDNITGTYRLLFKFNKIIQYYIKILSIVEQFEISNDKCKDFYFWYIFTKWIVTVIHMYIFFMFLFLSKEKSRYILTVNYSN